MKETYQLGSQVVSFVTLRDYFLLSEFHWFSKIKGKSSPVPLFIKASDPDSLSRAHIFFASAYLLWKENNDFSLPLSLHMYSFQLKIRQTQEANQASSASSPC